MLPFGSWIDLEGTLLSEIILISQKDKYYMISTICEIFKKKKVKLRNSRKVVARDCSWRIKRKKISWFKKQKIHLSVIRWIRSEESESHSVVSDSLQPHEPYSPWDSPGQNSEMGSLSLLQGIFPTQGWNPGLPHCSWILYQLSHQGSPRILEWVAYPFSGRSPWPRNQTGVSCISGGFFTSWAAREAQGLRT